MVAYCIIVVIMIFKSYFITNPVNSSIFFLQRGLFFFCWCVACYSFPAYSSSARMRFVSCFYIYIYMYVCIYIYICYSFFKNFLSLAMNIAARMSMFC